MLCESSTRKSVKDILRESCFKFDGTSKTKKFRNELNNITGEIHKLQIDNTQLKESIIDEMNNITTSQYIHLKSLLMNIQSSIPKTKDDLETYIKTKLSEVMTCIKTQSCKSQLTDLQSTLLEKLETQQVSIDDITLELEYGLTSIQEGITEFEMK